MPAPPAERLKIRCYRCNQLLAVVPGKAGTVVACPKCKADLLIPRPGPQQPADEPADPSVVALKSGTFPALSPIPETATATGWAGGAASSSFLEEIAAIIPPEVAALRPEDLRVEAEFFGRLTGEPAPPPPAADPVPFPLELTGTDLLPPAEADRPGPIPPLAGPAFTTEIGAGDAAGAIIPPPLPASAPVAVPEANVVVPPISIEPPAIRPAAASESQGIREVVLPASVVLAWSLFVLLAIPMAFIAGLMVGHYLWKFGP